jgi:hypothetical protein
MRWTSQILTERWFELKMVVPIDAGAPIYQCNQSSRETPMDAQTEHEDRLLSAAEREMVAQTRPPGISQMSREELQALGKRLREARDRSRHIASQQQREMRGKTEPRGAAAARDNTGSLGKTEVLVSALKRVTAALRQVKKPSAA